MKEAPLYVDANRLSVWIMERLGERNDALSRRVCNIVLDLSEHLTLALLDHDRSGRVAAADEDLVLLRLHLRNAGTLGLLEERQLRHALREADGIGRQLGGWRRAMDRVP